MVPVTVIPALYVAVTDVTDPAVVAPFGSNVIVYVFAAQVLLFVVVFGLGAYPVSQADIRQYVMVWVGVAAVVALHAGVAQDVALPFELFVQAVQLDAVEVL